MKQISTNGHGTDGRNTLGQPRNARSAWARLTSGAAMAVIAGSVVIGSAGVSLAQDAPAPTKLSPPTPGKPPSPPTFMVFLGILLIVAATAGANVIPAKRSHQD